MQIYTGSSLHFIGQDFALGMCNSFLPLGRHFSTPWALLGLQLQMKNCWFRGFPYTVKIKREVKDAAEAQVRTGTRSGSGHLPQFWALNHSVYL